MASRESVGARSRWRRSQRGLQVRAWAAIKAALRSVRSLGTLAPPEEVRHAGYGLGMTAEGVGCEVEDALQGHPDGLVPPLEEEVTYRSGKRLQDEVLEAPHPTICRIRRVACGSV